VYSVPYTVLTINLGKHIVVKMAELVPRLPNAPGWLYSLPFKLEQLCLYFMSISSALAIINLAPAYYLDGEYTFKAWIQIIFPDWPEEKRENVFRNVFRVVTALLIVNVVVSFVIMYL
jgi:membrane-associated protease RseP (regulator of RpoE activity)